MAHEPAREVLELLWASETERQSMGEETRPIRTTGLLVGVLAQLESSGEGRVAFDAASVNTPVRARSIVPVTGQDVGRQVCLMFEKGDPSQPVIIGFLHIGSNQTTVKTQHSGTTKTQPIETKIDGERIVLEGHKEIILKCGKASITLTTDGKVLVRGTYLSSRSSGPNLIKGGSVQLN